jgi:hypothetical protein
MGNQSLSVLTLTPRQAYEVSRLLDRTGDGIVYAHEGVLTLLVDVFGSGSPNLALELDENGDVIAKQVLTLHRRDAEDEFADLGDEQELPPPVDLRDARPAPRCECPGARTDDGITCCVCGHLLPGEAQEVVEAA